MNDWGTVSAVVGVLLTLAQIAIVVIALLVLPGGRRPQTAMAWLLLVLALPFLGFALFLLLGRNTVGRKRRAASLRQAATEHHGAVLGRGVLISKLNERRGRVERHLGLPPGRSSYRGAFTGTTLTLLKGLPPVLSSWVLHTR